MGFRPVGNGDFGSVFEMIREICDANGLHYMTSPKTDEADESLYFYEVLKHTAAALAGFKIKSGTDVKNVMRLCQTEAEKKRFKRAAQKMFVGGLFSSAELDKLTAQQEKFRKAAMGKAKKEIKNLRGGDVFYEEMLTVNQLVAEIKNAENGSDEQSDAVLRLLVQLVSLVEHNVRNLTDTEYEPEAIVALADIASSCAKYTRLNAKLEEGVREKNYRHIVSRMTPLGVEISEENILVLKIRAMQKYIAGEVKKQLDLYEKNRRGSGLNATSADIKSRIKLLRIYDKCLEDIAIRAEADNATDFNNTSVLIGEDLKRYDDYLQSKAAAVREGKPMPKFDLMGAGISSDSAVTNAYQRLSGKIDAYFKRIQMEAQRRGEIIEDMNFEDMLADDTVTQRTEALGDLLEQDMDELEETIASLGSQPEQQLSI